MRVISGEVRGRKLLSVKGLKTRPTSDKTKESIFNLISSHFEGNEVLDLFAGVGNLGLEALSRGATRAVFVEKDQDALSALKKNIANCGFLDKAQIIGNTVSNGMKILERGRNNFDFIFLDPPYGTGVLKLTLEKLSKSTLLNERSLIIAEYSSTEGVLGAIEGLKALRHKKYGAAHVSLLVPQGRGE